MHLNLTKSVRGGSLESSRGRSGDMVSSSSCTRRKNRDYGG